MKVTASRLALAKALMHLQPAMQKHTSSNPAHARFEVDTDRLVITGYSPDSTMGVRVSIPLLVVNQDGCALLPYRRFTEMLKECKDTILQLETQDYTALLHLDHSTLALPALPCDDPVVWMPPDAPCWYQCAAGDLRRIYERTSPFTALNHSRLLDSTLLEFNGAIVTAISTDGGRLAKATVRVKRFGVESDQPEPVVVPLSWWIACKRSFTGNHPVEIYINAQAKKIWAQGRDLSIVATLYENKYPDVHRLWMESKWVQYVEMNSAELARAVQLVMSGVTERDILMQITIQPDSVHLAVEHKDTQASTATVLAAGNVSNRKIATRARWMADFSHIIRNDGLVKLYVQDNNNPILFSVPDYEVVMAVTPV